MGDLKRIYHADHDPTVGTDYKIEHIQEFPSMDTYITAVRMTRDANRSPVISNLNSSYIMNQNQLSERYTTE